MDKVFMITVNLSICSTFMLKSSGFTPMDRVRIGFRDRVMVRA